jgi:hypothetical protein
MDIGDTHIYIADWRGDSRMRQRGCWVCVCSGFAVAVADDQLSAECRTCEMESRESMGWTAK